MRKLFAQQKFAVQEASSVSIVKQSGEKAFMRIVFEIIMC
jgi:hypothetical protein